MPMFWLSFADERGFLGVAIVHADDFTEAVRQCNAREINPGGQVAAVPLSAELLIAEKWKNRLLTRAECLAVSREVSISFDAPWDSYKPQPCVICTEHADFRCSVCHLYFCTAQGCGNAPEQTHHPCEYKPQLKPERIQ